MRSCFFILNRVKCNIAIRIIYCLINNLVALFQNKLEFFTF